MKSIAYGERLLGTHRPAKRAWLLRGRPSLVTTCGLQRGAPTEDALTSSESLFGDVFDQVDDSAGVAPFIVIPRQQLHQVPFDDARVWRVENRRVRVSSKVDRDQRFFGILEYPAQRTLCSLPHCRIHLLLRRVCRNFRYKVDDRNVRSGNAE